MGRIFISRKGRARRVLAIVLCLASGCLLGISPGIGWSQV